MDEWQRHLITISETCSRIEQKIDGHMEDDAREHKRLSDHVGHLYQKTEKSARFEARTKGAASAVFLVWTALLGWLGIDKFGG